ncbi:MAG: hypothetical protein RLZZ65_1756 [Bacteroidota bacterium]|jgi:uncharacterized delta-60 repeat protein
MKFIFFLFTSLFALHTFAQTPGSLDLTFATVGYASYGPVSTTSFDNAQDVVTLPSGQILFCGTAGTSGNLDICVVRLNADGTIDNTFGNNGYYLHPNSGGSDFAYDMEVLSNGQILVAGALSITAANPQFALLSINPNGTLNTAFGTNGVFANDIDASEDYARKILLSGTTITLVGSSKLPGFTTNRIAATRCDLNGVLDLSFGTAGKTTLSNGNSNMTYSACWASNNDIVVCGDAYISNVYYPMMAKMTSAGAAVASFGTGGIWVSMSQNSRYFDIDYIAGKLIVSGNDGASYTDFLLQARNENTGALVTTFGSGGSTITNLNNSDTYYEVLAHPDGSLLACGTTGAVGIGAARDFIISKYNANGILETSWGTNGHTVTSIYANWDDAYGMDLYPNNKVVIAGFSAQTNPQFAVARYIYSNTVVPVYGCMNPSACNYNPLATVDNGTCILPGSPCNDNNPNTINDVIDANCNCTGTPMVMGCMDPSACNYNPLANMSSGICILPGSPCNDNNPNTINDVIDANCNCTGVLLVPGCMNPAACNYNPLANVDNNSCLFPGNPCNDNNPNTINDSINPDCNCVGELIVNGCTDPLSCNYNPLANVDDNSCIFPGAACDDNNADTFNDVLDANCNCVGTEVVMGCMDSSACNFNPLANTNDNSCIFPGSPCDDNNALTINDSINDNCQCVGQDISGIKEFDLLANVSPNPTTGQLTIQLAQTEPATIYICNLEGKVLQENKMDKPTLTLQLGTLAKGTYLIKVVQKGQLQIHKIILQ